MTQEMSACAIGARSQMARTYLERNLDKFGDCGAEELVAHGLSALKESLAQDKELTVDNTCVGVVNVKGSSGGEYETFKLYEGLEVERWIKLVAEKEGEDAPGGESMEVDS